MRKYYLPHDFPGRFIWCDNFVQKLATLMEKYGVTTEQWIRLKDGTRALGQANEFIDRVATLGHSWSQYRQQLWQDTQPHEVAPPFDNSLAQQIPAIMSDFEDDIRRVVKQIQSHPAYTEADGKALGLFGPEISVDTATAKPLPRLLLTGSKVHVVYDKHNRFTGVRVWVNRATGEFELLGTYTRAAFEDPATLPDEAQTWSYRMQYLLGDTPVGQVSDSHDIVVASSLTR